MSIDIDSIAELRRREVLSALLKAKETIRALHGINCRDSAEEDELWSLYQSSPEMKQINAAIDNLQKPQAEDAR